MARANLEIAVCVLSKGRAGLPKAKTFKLLSTFNGRVFVFVEPQEVLEYQRAYPNYSIVNIEATDNGEAYVRNFILCWGLVNLYDYVFMLDDNIREFNRTYHRQSHKCDFDEVFVYVTNLINEYSPDAIGLNNSAMAVFAKRYLEYGRNLFCCFLLSTKLDFAYDETLAIRCDIEFLLQLLVAKKKLISTNLYSFNKPSAGSTKVGGLRAVYDKLQLLNDCAIEVHSRYPTITKLINRGERGLNVNILWKNIKSL